MCWPCKTPSCDERVVVQFAPLTDERETVVTRVEDNELPACLRFIRQSDRYPEEPKGLLMLDPQLVCYSWVTGISDVAQVVFVRKRLVEIQYFRTTITDEQRGEFNHLVEDTIRRIESAQFLPHSGVRFPQNPCTSCPYVGLCLGQPELVETNLVRRPGEDLGLLDELTYYQSAHAAEAEQEARFVCAHEDR